MRLPVVGWATSTVRPTREDAILFSLRYPAYSYQSKATTPSVANMPMTRPVNPPATSEAR